MCNYPGLLSLPVGLIRPEPCRKRSRKKRLTTGSSVKVELAHATDIARQLITRFGMSTELGLAVLERKSASYLGERMEIGDKDYSEQTAREVDLAIRALLAEAYQRASTLLESHREDLDTGAHLLVEKETLTPGEFAPLLPLKHAALALRLV